MGRDTRPKKIIIAVLVGILILVLFNSFEGRIRSFFYYFSSPVQRAFFSWGDGFSDFLSGFLGRGEIDRERENLKLENQKLISEIIYLDSLKEENQNLREAMDLGLAEEFELSFSRILGKDISGDIILIDKGSEEGIAEDMPVITSEKVLAGKISEVYKNFSKVELLSNKGMSFGAGILGKDVAAAAKGQGGSDLLLDLIPKDKELAVGDSVITAGLEKTYPPDILVGRIREIQKKDVESIQRAFVDVSFDLDKNHHLLIIKNF